MESKSSKDIYDKLMGKPLKLKKPEEKKYDYGFIKTSNVTLSNSESEICIILSHADTHEKKELLHECLESVKIPKLISSHYPVDTDTQSLSNWTLYDYDNDLLLESEYKKYNLSYYYWKIDDDGKMITKNQSYEHGYAVYKLIKNALMFSKSLGKTIAHIVNYDYLIPSQMLIENSAILKDYDVVLYTDESNMLGQQYCTGLFSGNIDALLAFFQHYENKDQYYLDLETETVSTIWIEGKIFKFYKTRDFKIMEKSIDALKKQAIYQDDLKIDRVTLMRGTFD